MGPKSQKKKHNIPEQKQAGVPTQQNNNHPYVLFDNMLEGCQIIGFDWRYIYVNDSVTKHGRQTKENLLNHTMMEVYPGIQETGMFAALQECMEKRVARQMENEFTYPDGSKGWFELSIQPIPEGVLVLSSDVTERVRAEKQVIQLKRLYATLSQVNQTIVHVKDRNELYQAICDVAVEYGEFALVWIGLLDEDSGTVHPVVAKGLDVTQWPFPIVNIHEGELKNGLVATAIRTSKVVTSEDIQNNPGSKSLHALFKEHGYRSSAVVPFRLDDKTIGILSLVSLEADLFKVQDETRLLEEMGLDISFALATMKLEAERKQAEEERASLARFPSENPNPVMRFGQDGLILYANEASQSLLNEWGSRAGSYAPGFWCDLAVDTLTNQTSKTVEVRHNGQILSFFVVPIVDAGYVNIYGRDITKRMQAEDELRKSEERFRSLYENATIGMYRTTPDGKILLANPALVKMLGYASFEELVQRNLEQEGYDPDYERDIFRQQIERDGIVIGLESAWTRKDGETIFVRESAKAIRDVDSKVIYYEGTVEDITEHKRAEKKLIDSELRYRRLFESAQDAILILNAVSGEVVAANPFVENLLEYPVDGLIGKQIWQLGFLKDIADNKTKLQELREKKYVRYENLPLQTQSGKAIYVEFVSNVYTVDGVNVIQCNIRDITQRKQAEEKIERQNQRLKVLREIDVAILAAKLVENIVGAALNHIRELIGCHRAGMTLIDWEANEAAIFDVRTAGETSVTKGSRVPLMLFQAMPQAMSKPLANNQPVLLPDLTELPDLPPLLQILSKEGMRSVCILPLFSQGNQIGTFNLLSETPGFFDEERIGLGREVANQVAIAITQNRLIETLRESEDKYRTFFQNSMDAILLTTPDGGIQAANPAACKMLGRTEDEICALGRAGVTDQSDPRLDILLEERSRNGKAFGELTMLRGDGSPFSVEISSAIFRDRDGKERTSMIIRDITERKQAEEKIEEQLTRLAALREIDQAINSSFDLGISMNILLSHTIRLLNVDAATILQLNSEINMLEYIAQLGFRTRMVKNSHIKIGESYAGRVALERRLIQIQDLASAPNNTFVSNLLADENFVSYYGTPLIVKGMIIGVLEVFSRSSTERDDDWFDFLNTLAGQAAIAIDNLTLFNDLQHSNLELLMAYDATIEGWSRAMDLRDEETEGHTKRVTELAMRLAVRMGINSQDQVHLRRGALLHDIGKLGVPDHILLKPGKLDEEEWTLMRQHARYAFEMLMDISYLRPALDIPYCHHEKWDGSGYPRGLKGNQIPLAARIFAVVDVWDALCSDRPYRLSWSAEQARTYIIEQSGKHFDPDVVEEFLNLIAEE